MYFGIGVEDGVGENGLIFEGFKLLLCVKSDFSDGQVLVGKEFLLAKRSHVDL